MSDGPKLLIEWSSPWEEFVTSIEPALGRSPKRLAGEAQTGLFPYRGMLISWVFEALLLAAVIIIPSQLQSLRPYTPPAPPKYDVIYFSGDELPKTEDTGGAQAGKTGAGGGQESHHRTQTIRVARGSAVTDKVVDAPKLKLPQTTLDAANLLAFKQLPGPAPAEGLHRSTPFPTLPQMNAVAPTPDLGLPKLRAAPALNTGVVAPTPSISRDRMREAASLTASAVAPPSRDVQRDLGSAKVPVASVSEIVAPPVSAPERESSAIPKLTLPAPNVVAPPPSQVSRGNGVIAGVSPVDPRSQVVPPPVQTGSRSLGANGPSAALGGGTSTVVAPPSQSGSRSLNRSTTGSLVGNSTVVAPPVDSGNRALGGQTSSGVLGAANVVPPPPSVAGSGAAGGEGQGNKGAGRGSAMDLGSTVAPPGGGGGSGGGSGVVISSKPGTAVGVPGGGTAGALAMSPSGGDKPGAGGSGGGSGIGTGAGPGSGLQGQGPGAGHEGVGKGSDPNARNGISPYPGPGGAGKATAGSPAVPGVSVQGGNTVTLPSFGSTQDGGSSAPGRSSVAGGHHGPGITVVATSRSGGAFNFYGQLKGDRVYTIYIGTSSGTVVMQYADPGSTSHPYAEDLTAPDPLHADLPLGLLHTRVVIACVLDRAGGVKNPQVLEAGNADTTAKIMGAISNWKFRPVLRGEQPVEVNAILGFNIDTR